MGYINRDIYHGLSWNNIGGKSDIMNHNCDNSRVKKLNINIVPIKINLNGYILICGQLPWDRQVSYLNIPYNTWLNNFSCSSLLSETENQFETPDNMASLTFHTNLSY